MQTHQPALDALEGVTAFIRKRYAPKLRSLRCVDIEDFLQEIRRTILRSQLFGKYEARQWHVCVLLIAARQFRKQSLLFRHMTSSERLISQLPKGVEESALGVADSSLVELHDCVHKLSELDQQIIDLMLKEYTAAEISRLTRIPETSVARIMNRIRLKLGVLFNDHDD